MKNLPVSQLVQITVDLLREAYEGVPAGTPTWFIDNGPDSGILALLRNVSAEEAYRPARAGGDNGVTVASHAGHLHWSLALVNRTLRGEPYQANWSESWNPLENNPQAWDQLRAGLTKEYEDLRHALTVLFQSEGSPVDFDEDTITGMLALVPHAAYHLATIQQILERVRAE